MQVQYRKMRLSDEEAVFTLRMRMWDAPSVEYVRQGARLDPQYLNHTFVAIGPDGDLLSTVRYWLRDIRDVSGVPQRVGCVASVATVESARRQGHASRLMQLAIRAMQEEGCAWTFLLSSDMGVPLYEGLGYRAFPVPYYLGALSGERPQSAGGYDVRRVTPPFDFGDSDWQAVRDIYAAYNAHRPLSLVRDDVYWQGYFARRIRSRVTSRNVALFRARTPSGHDAGYLLADYSTKDDAREDSGLGQLIFLSEVGLLPSHNAALPALLNALLDGAAMGRVDMSVRVPSGGYVDEVVSSLFGPDVQLLDCGMMALPLGNGSSMEEIAAMFDAPGALFGIVDDF